MARLEEEEERKKRRKERRRGVSEDHEEEGGKDISMKEEDMAYVARVGGVPAAAGGHAGGTNVEM